jgi:hypothetical protein
MVRDLAERSYRAVALKRMLKIIDSPTPGPVRRPSRQAACKSAAHQS